jgi:hypothetical protein
MHITSEETFGFKPFKIIINFHSETEARQTYAILEGIEKRYEKSKSCVSEVCRMFRSEIVNKLNDR